MENELPSLYSFVKNSADKYRNKIAYEFIGSKIIYDVFIKQIDKTAFCLHKLGIKEDDVMCVVCPNIPQAITMIYAANKIGAIVNMVHPLSSENEIKDYVNKVNAKAILILDSFYDKLLKIENEINVEHIIVCDIADALSPIKKFAYHLKNKRVAIKSNAISWNDFINLNNENNNINEITNRIDNISIMLYSGGTTGKVKAVCLSNRQINESANQMLQANPMICSDDKFLSVMPIFHGNGLVIGIHSMLMVGADCILIPRFTPETYAKDLLKNKCNYMSGVPALYERLLNLDIMKNADLSFLKGAFCGADSLSIELERRINNFFKERNATISVCQGYGMTEGVVASTMNPRNNPKEGSIGKPFDGVKIKIVKPDTEEELPNGEIGEIVFSSVTNMMYYLNDPEETAKTKRLHSDGLYWIHSGDLGSRDDDGYFYFKGRIKRMIVKNGYNVFPNELENIIESFAMVDKCCVVGVPNESGTSIIKVYIVLKNGYEKSEKTKLQILDLCKTYISKYALPKQIEFIDELPKTKVGKVDYNSLIK